MCIAAVTLLGQTIRRFVRRELWPVELSVEEQERIPEDQWCYEPNEEDEYAEGMKVKENFLELTGYRLPTEAEWEYAARAGSQGPFSFEGSISSEKANYNAKFTYEASREGQFRKQTVPVGTLPANPWGLHEMHGNATKKLVS